MRKQIFEDKSDGTNLDILAGYNLKKCLELTEGFKSILPPIEVKKVGNFYVVDEGANGFVGTNLIGFLLHGGLYHHLLTHLLMARPML